MHEVQNLVHMFKKKKSIIQKVMQQGYVPVLGREVNCA